MLTLYVCRENKCIYVIIRELHEKGKSKCNGVFVHAVKACGGVEVYLHSFLKSVLTVGEWRDIQAGRFMPGERTPIHIENEAKWASELVWAVWRSGIYLAPVGN
jgi:hypothetical protein